MQNEDMKTALFVTALVAAGAVALILYQHATHTGSILGALGAAPASPDSASSTSPASIAGTPSPGQPNLQPTPSMTVAATAGANWQMNGTTGPTATGGPGNGVLGWSN